MSTQAITDYLTKQVFIEKNVVTYRSLSRQFSIHVNAAKNELATYHHEAPYKSQHCVAIFLLSGTLKYKSGHGHGEDIDMDNTPSASQEEEDDSEEVPTTTVTIVNEKDLEDAQAAFEDLQTIYVYSLSPAPLHDAGLLCTPTEDVRNTDKTKGPTYSATVGRVTSNGIKFGVFKKKAQPSAPVAGPSKLKMPAAPEPKPAPKTEAKDETAEKAKEKPKATGKLQFFSKPKEAPKVVKKEEPADSKKKMFFSKPAPKAPSPKTVAKDPSPPVPETKQTISGKEKEKEKEVESKPAVQDTKPAPARGVKRKSSVGFEQREKTPENPAIAAASSKVENTAKIRRRVVLFDDESDTVPVKTAQRKSRINRRTESTDNSEAEREAMALMDIDDDEVEKVSRVPSTNVSSNEDDNEDDSVSTTAQDEDVDMEEEAPVKPKARTRKPKTVIPVGRNGLKKKKVIKTRRTIGDDGYTRKEDYSDWESVDGDGDEPETPAPAKTKAKAKATTVKKEPEDVAPPPANEKEKEKAKEVPPPKKAATKTSKPSAKAGSGVKGKGQQQKLNFFGPKKT